MFEEIERNLSKAIILVAILGLEISSCHAPPVLLDPFGNGPTPQLRPVGLEVRLVAACRDVFLKAS